MKITFVGNEGVLVNSDGRSILIDALFGDGVSPYATTTRQMMDTVSAGRGEFGNVDAVVATHHHPDHFDPHAVARYLTNNEASRFVSTPQAVSLLERKTGGYAAVSDRIVAVSPDDGHADRVDLGGLVVCPFGLSHGKVNFKDVQHLGVLVEMGGRSLLHLGDGIIDARALSGAGVLDREIDVGFLPFWYLTYPAGQSLLGSRLRLSNIFAVHVPPPRRQEIESLIAAAVPDATAMVTPMGAWEV